MSAAYKEVRIPIDRQSTPQRVLEQRTLLKRDSVYHSRRTDVGGHGASELESVDAGKDQG